MRWRYSRGGHESFAHLHTHSTYCTFNHYKAPEPHIRRNIPCSNSSQNCSTHFYYCSSTTAFMKKLYIIEISMMYHSSLSLVSHHFHSPLPLVGHGHFKGTVTKYLWSLFHDSNPSRLQMHMLKYFLVLPLISRLLSLVSRFMTLTLPSDFRLG